VLKLTLASPGDVLMDAAKHLRGLGVSNAVRLLDPYRIREEFPSHAQRYQQHSASD
jgi:hypothetical protein